MVIRSAQRVTMMPRRWSWQGVALTGLVLLAALYTLDAARYFLMPTMLAVILAVILTPVCRRLESIRLPPALSALITVLMALVIAVSLLVPLAPAFDDWSNRLPRAAQRLEFELREIKESVEKIEAVTKKVEKATDLGSDKARREVVIQDRGLLTHAVATAPAIAAQTLYATLLVYFLLSERRRLLRTMVSLSPGYAAARRLCEISRDIGRVVSRYLFSVASINAGLGMATAAALYLFGLPNAVLWGTGMAVLNFIPYLGPSLMLVIIFGVGMSTYDSLAESLLPVATVLGLNIIESQIVVPSIVGKRVAMSPLVVFLAVAFWGWMWGILGAIVAVPITIVAATIARHSFLPAPGTEPYRHRATAAA